MCDMPGIHTCKRECIGDDPIMDKEVRENTDTTNQEEDMAFSTACEKVLDESKEVLIGAGIGLAYGGVVSTLVIAQSCVQIAVYPVYMANCAVRPFLNLLTPLWLPAFTTFVGACGGLGAKLAK